MATLWAPGLLWLLRLMGNLTVVSVVCPGCWPPCSSQGGPLGLSSLRQRFPSPGPAHLKLITVMEYVRGLGLFLALSSRWMLTHPVAFDPEWGMSTEPRGSLLGVGEGLKGNEEGEAAELKEQLALGLEGHVGVSFETWLRVSVAGTCRMLVGNDRAEQTLPHQCPSPLVL